MGLNIGSIGLTNVQQSTSTANWDRLASGFRELLSSVQRGDLSSAQKALNSLAESDTKETVAPSAQVKTSAPIGTPENPYTEATLSPLEAWLGMGQPIDPVYFAQRQAQAATDQARMGYSAAPAKMSAREQQLHDQGVAAFNYMQSKGLNPYDYMGGNGGPAGSPGSGPCVFTTA